MRKPTIRITRAATFMLPLLFVLAEAPQAGAEVFVVANRSVDPIQFAVSDAHGGDRAMLAESGRVLSVPLNSEGELTIRSGVKESAYTVQPYAVYFLHGDSRGGFALQQIGLPSVPMIRSAKRVDAGPVPTAGTGSATLEPAPRRPLESQVTLKVKVLADEEIVGSYRDWVERLKQRVADASRILSEHCGLRLEIVEVGTWRSDNSQTDFVKTMGDFERQAPLAAGQVAIGFTGQYRRPEGRTKLGGIRGPLHPHILIREWPRHVSERERLELLVHELGHYLGAVHSPESDSVMRPILADRQAMYRRFQVKFDPINTLVMNLVARGMRNGAMGGLDDLREQTKLVLRGVYTDVGRAMPDDPTPSKYVGLLNLPTIAARSPQRSSRTRNLQKRRQPVRETPRTSGGR